MIVSEKEPSSSLDARGKVSEQADDNARAKASEHEENDGQVRARVAKIENAAEKTINDPQADGAQWAETV